MTEDELLQLIQIQMALNEGRTALNLSNQNLSSLPPEIGKLTSLQSLHLGSNRLSSLPPEIGKLTSLQSLHLGFNRLNSLPPEIGKLTSLQSLHLGSNRLSSLPPEIGKLTSLQSLDLWSNQLSSLPPEIGKLTSLQSLHLGSNRLSSLPPEIGKLTSLQSLHLRSNRLSSLPPEIGKLTSLQSLDLWSNQLSSLPPEIGKLTSLQSLDLRSNRLSSLPPEIGKLTSLQSLNLRSNRLSSLPPEIGKLTSLQSLDLRSNRLSSLPPEITKLTSLQSPPMSRQVRSWLDSLMDLPINLRDKLSMKRSPINEETDLAPNTPDNLHSVLASGEFPKKAEHRAANVPAQPERSPVDCTVFAPDRVERKQTALLQVFVHAPEARNQAEAAAETFDPETKERGHRYLVLDAPIGTTFAFDVEIEGFVLRERTDKLLWTGRPQAATFRFDVPKGCKLGQHTGTVRISKDGTPVGRISFEIEVVRDGRDTQKRPVGKEARHYHACFCSYSSLDREEMLKRAQGLLATGLETFIDVLKLRPGDIWNPKILAAIDESDLFVVIWPKNARDSKWVKK